MKRLSSAIAVIGVAILFGAPSVSASPFFKAVSGSYIGVGSSPDHSQYGKAEIIGFDDESGVYLKSSSGTSVSFSAIHRFSASGQLDTNFNSRVRPDVAPNSSAAVVDNKLLVTKGKQLKAFRSDGLIASDFGNAGTIRRNNHLADVIGDGNSGFFLASYPRNHYADVLIEHLDAKGKRLARTTLQGTPWFQFQAVSSEGDLAYTIRYSSDDGDDWETLSVLKKGLKARSKLVKTIEFSSFDGVDYLAGANLLLSYDGYSVAVDAGGKIQTDFGTQGNLNCVTESGDGPGPSSPTLTTIDPDGKIVGIGPMDQGGCELQRFFADGKPDSGFVFGGGPDWKQNQPKDLKASADRVLVSSWNTEKGGPRLDAFRNDGSIDTAFGDNGVAQAILSTPDSARTKDSILVSGGNLLVASLAVSADRESSGLVLSRFGSNASPDRSYGTQGRARLDLGGKVKSAELTRLPSGRVMVSGTVATGGAATSGYFVRLNDNGTVDLSFGDQGVMLFSRSSLDRIAFNSAVESDRGLVVTGSACCRNGDQDVLIAAFDENGSLDPDFVGGKIVLQNLADFPVDKREGDKDVGIDIDLDHQGNPVVLATTTPKGSYPVPLFFGFARNPEGASIYGKNIRRVPSFRVIKDATGRWSRFGLDRPPTGIRVLPTGKVAVSFGAQSQGFVRWRRGFKTVGSVTVMNRNGSLDRKFGNRGQVLSQSHSFQDMDLDRCGRIIVGGSAGYKSRVGFGVRGISKNGKVFASSRPGSVKIGKPNWIEQGGTLTLSGRRAFVAGDVGGAWNAKTGLVSFRANTSCR